MPQAKADRSAAAKKAAVTRKRNQEKQGSQVAGKKAATTRQRRDAQATAGEAKSAAKGAVSGVQNSVRLAGEALKQASKAATNTVGAIRKRGD